MHINNPQSDLQQVMLLDKYARWRPTDNRRENWPEVVERVMSFFGQQLDKHQKDITTSEWEELTQAFLDMDVLPSMRIVQMAGAALERCNVGAYNCAYLPLQDTQAFAELLYILMQGTGVGFSVEGRYVDQWPVVRPLDHTQPIIHHTIPDTTEGWCDALKLGLDCWLNGQDVVFDYSAIRPYGTPLATKGGRASGPEPLQRLLEFARKLICHHVGRKLSSLNLHDLACYCGSIVQVGGVRRAAEISLSDWDDDKLAHAKMGRFYETFPERSMANNSAVFMAKPSMKEWFDYWTTLMESGTGERGIFNREGIGKQLPYRRANDHVWGVNPCGEVVLRPFEFCNLSIAVARPNDTIQSLLKKVNLATKFGMMQSLLTNFNYIRPEWTVNCREERLLGVDITGQMDCGLFVGSRADGTYTLAQREALYEADRLSSLFNIPMPAAVTCVKPSGNSSQLLNCSSGIHPRYAPYYIRRLRVGSSSPIAQMLVASGVPHHPEVGQSPDNPSVWVFEFPVASPKGAIVRSDVSALDQLEQWLSCKINYTEHNPSITVYVKDHEWMEVGAWVYRHWESVGGISFLPYDGGSYILAPYEEISEATYNTLVAQWPHVDFSTLSKHEQTDHTTVNQEYACVGGTCEL